MIVLCRIDDRLIHGQVVEGWVNFVKATGIFVADDRAAANALQCTIMEMSAPSGLTVCIGRIEDICEKVRSSSSEKERIILLFANPASAVRALNAGIEFRELNVGGMHYMAGKCKLLDVLAVDAADVQAFRELVNRGVKVVIQTVPTERPLPIGKVLREFATDQAV
ncbi:MAG: hypothetical protein A2X56_05350 [Nitrospirae bacterium GWC2_57_13]|jgi:mannose/fructose/N-acetylgalactosamine-specific phosphotransferase system component IIB|nr:MAG: hypothetical protein A2X56_05350 [Nitrospirae bacterium GWC2_57_13]HAR44890.1 hypothetical protein [Nitrospiraceae bacterium]HAS55170.1 hypothetical protein [Nitrospiraceae bacterium]